MNVYLNSAKEWLAITRIGINRGTEWGTEQHKQVEATSKIVNSDCMWIQAWMVANTAQVSIPCHASEDNIYKEKKALQTCKSAL